MPINKPSTCEGCSFYSKSQYYTPSRLLPNSEILLLAQAPDNHGELGHKIVGEFWSSGKKQENIHQVTPQPLIGRTGRWLQSEFWPLTKLNYSDVSLDNVIKCRPYNSNELPDIGSNKPVNGITVKELKLAISHCTSHHMTIPENTKFILAMGEIALYGLTGEKLLNYRKHQLDEEGEGKRSTITEWRGWALGVDLVEKHILGLYDYYQPMEGSSLYPRLVTVFPVVHLASLFQNDKYYHATLHDFQRFGRLVRGEWPKATPNININTIPKIVPEAIGFDTEYDVTDNNSLIMWSMADVDYNVYVVDADYSRQLTNLPNQLTIVTQNGLVDLPHFLPLLPSSFNLAQLNMEDCMLGHAVNWTGEPNSLDYQLSKIGEYNRHKHLRVIKDKYLGYFYAGLDADTTLNSAWKAIVKDFKKDRLSFLEYKKRRQPLLYPISKFQSIGALIDKSRIDLVTSILDSKILEIESKARLLLSNDDFNIRSNDQIKEILYGIHKVKKEKEAQSTTIRQKVKRITSKGEKVSKKGKEVQEELYTRLLGELKAKYGN